MTTYFLDSSALLKRYVIEVGTNWIRWITLPAGHSIVVAQITSAEIVSGVMRRKREGAILTSTAQAIRLLVDRHTRREYNTISLSSQVIQNAEDLLEKHPLQLMTRFN